MKYDRIKMTQDADIMLGMSLSYLIIYTVSDSVGYYDKIGNSKIYSLLTKDQIARLNTCK
jgi:hypothetical protein